MIRSLRRGVLAVPFLVLVAAAGGVGAQFGKGRLIVEDLDRFDAPRDTALAPDGKSLVYSRQWIDAKEKVDRFSLWRVEGESANAKPMEKGEPDARALVYSPDSKWIAFLSTRPRPDGWKQTLPTPLQSDPALDIWFTPAAGGEPIPLAGPEKPYGRVFNDGFYGRLAFSPDGTKLAFIADDGKDTRTEAEKAHGVAVTREDQGEGYTGWGAAQLWVAHLDPKPGKFAASKIDRITDDDAWYGDPNWHPNGKTIAVHANLTTDRESARFSINKNFDIWTFGLEPRMRGRLTTGPGPQVSPRYSPDGTQLACLSVPRKGSHRDAFDLIVVSAGEKPPVRFLMDLHGKGEDKAPILVPSLPLPTDCWDGNRRLLVNCESGVNTVTRWVDATTGKLDTPVPVSLLVPDAGPSPLEGRIARRAQLTPPGNLFLKERTLGKQQVVKWKSTDGTEIEGILTLPAFSPGGPPYPLVVHPHGGPHSRSTLGFDFTAQVFAGRGYAVFQPNFRGSSGYGQKFIDADRGDFGGGDMQDILSGVDKLIADGAADQDRLFIYGVSYGGFMTSWLVGQTDRFKAAVAQNAVTDLNMMWGLSDLQSWTEWEFGGKPWEVPEKMRKHSPLAYVDKVKTPTLVLHSRDDRRCPLPMGQAYHRALKAHGVPTDLVIYPDEGHGIKQPRHRADVLNRVLEWFAKYDKR